VSGDGSGSAGGLAFTNVATVDALGGTDTVELTGADETATLTAANSATDSTSSIAYSNIETIDGGAGADILQNQAGGTYALEGNATAGVSQSNFETVDTAALSLTSGDDTFAVSGDGSGSAGGLAFTNVATVDALGGTDTVELTGADETATLTSANSATDSTSSIAYSNIETIDGGAGADILQNQAGGTYALEGNATAGVSQSNFETVDTAALSLTSGDDTFAVSGDGSGSAGGLAFTNVATVDALGGTDTVELTGADETATLTSANSATDSTSSIAYSNIETIDGGAGADILQNQAGGTYALEGNATAGVSQSNFETVDTAALSLTSGDDTFAYSGNGAGSVDGVTFTGLASVDALAGTDAFLNSSSDTFNAGDGSLNGLQTSAFEAVQTSQLNLTDGNDTFTVTGTSAGTSNNVAYSGLSTVDALGGIDAVLLSTGYDAFEITGVNMGSGSAIAFSGIESVDAVTGTGSLVNSTVSTFLAQESLVAGISVGNFTTIQTAGLNLTDGDDNFAVTDQGTGLLEGSPITYTGLSQVDALGGTNRLINNSDQAYIAETSTVAGITVSNFGVVFTPNLQINLGDDDDRFEITGLSAGIDLVNNTVYDGLLFVDAQGGADQLINSTGLSFSLVPEQADVPDSFTGTLNGSVAGVTVGNFETIETPLLSLTQGNDTLSFNGAGSASVGSVQFTGLTTVDALAGEDSFINESTASFDAPGASVDGLQTAGFESVQTAILGLNPTGDTFTVTGGSAGLIDGSDVAYSGLNEVNASSGTTVLLPAGNDAFTVTGPDTGAAAGIAFTGLQTVDATSNNGTLTNDTPAVYTVGSTAQPRRSDTVGDLNLLGFNSVDAIFVSLPQDISSFDLSGSFTENSVDTVTLASAGSTFTGISSVFLGDSTEPFLSIDPGEDLIIVRGNLDNLPNLNLFAVAGQGAGARIQLDPGTRITTGGDLRLQADGDIDLGSVGASSGVALNAGNDLVLHYNILRVYASPEALAAGNTLYLNSATTGPEGTHRLGVDNPEYDHSDAVAMDQEDTAVRGSTIQVFDGSGSATAFNGGARLMVGRSESIYAEGDLSLAGDQIYLGDIVVKGDLGITANELVFLIRKAFGDTGSGVGTFSTNENFVLAESVNFNPSGQQIRFDNAGDTFNQNRIVVGVVDAVTVGGVPTDGTDAYLVSLVDPDLLNGINKDELAQQADLLNPTADDQAEVIAGVEPDFELVILPEGGLDAAVLELLQQIGIWARPSTADESRSSQDNFTIFTQSLVEPNLGEFHHGQTPDVFLQLLQVVFRRQAKNYEVAERRISQARVQRALDVYTSTFWNLDPDGELVSLRTTDIREVLRSAFTAYSATTDQPNGEGFVRFVDSRGGAAAQELDNFRRLFMEIRALGLTRLERTTCYRVLLGPVSGFGLSTVELIDALQSVPSPNALAFDAK
jgi:hypothetical protein